MADPIIVLTPTAFAPYPAPYAQADVIDTVLNLLTAGTGISLTYDDVFQTLTITNTGGGTTPVVPITLGALTLSPTTFTVGA